MLARLAGAVGIGKLRRLGRLGAPPGVPSNGDKPSAVDQAAHALRTTIAVARGHSELIRTAHGGQQAADDAEVILSQLERMERIAERLLILAAADHPHFLRREPVELEPLLVDAVRRWSSVAPRHWAVDGVGAEGTLIADRQRLDAGLDALLENAVACTTENQRIALRGWAEGDDAVIEVEDGGNGISPDQHGPIFDRFTRAGPVPGGSAAGLGLGLAVVKVVAEAHGGSVSVQSQPGRGASFRLRLPGFDPADAG